MIDAIKRYKYRIKQFLRHLRIRLMNLLYSRTIWYWAGYGNNPFSEKLVKEFKNR